MQVYLYIYQMQLYLQIFDFSKITRCENFSSSAPPKPGLFSIARFLRLTENLREQKHFLKT